LKKVEKAPPKRRAVPEQPILVSEDLPHLLRGG
jgi:hypothetical protein